MPLREFESEDPKFGSKSFAESLFRALKMAGPEGLRLIAVGEPGDGARIIAYECPVSGEAPIGFLDLLASGVSASVPAPALAPDEASDASETRFRCLDYLAGRYATRSILETGRGLPAPRAATTWPDWMILESVTKGHGLTTEARRRALRLAEMGYIDAAGTWKLTPMGQEALAGRAYRLEE
jgi:hypothetical protein